MRLLVSIWLAAATAFALLPSQSRAADQAVALQQALGSPDPLYRFSPEALEAGVKLCSSRDPGHAGGYVILVLRSGRNDADAIAPALVTAAIQGLGDNPKPAIIGGIVRAAVKTAPSEVLDIVKAAAKASPRGAATGIVTAAVGSVPHPEDMVTVNTEPRENFNSNGGSQADGKDGKEISDGKSLAPAQKQLTLAEAIVQTVLAADPDLSVATLTTAADAGIGGPQDPFLTTDLNPVTPILPVGPGNNTNQFGAPGPVSP